MRHTNPTSISHLHLGLTATTLLCLALLSALLTGCRSEDEPITPSTPTEVGGDSTFAGFYLLNEGNMGSNKCTLDWYDAAAGVYHRNVFAERNPQVAQELGDVGNDLQRYGSRLYAVVNGSRCVEVMDLSARHVAQISIPNCRYIAFHEGYAYVTSYAGPIELDPNARLGYVAKVDTATLRVVDECVVGYQPDELAVLDGRLYVANSGGYLVGRYDRTVSVIDLRTFREERKLDVAVNLHRIRADRHGQLWVTSRGDYGKEPGRLLCLKDEHVVASLPLSIGDFDIVGDTLYYFTSQAAAHPSSVEANAQYGRLDVRSHELLDAPLVADGTDSAIQRPYGLKVNPVNGDFYLADAGNYVTPGRLYCFDCSGRKKWTVATGDIPAHICLLFGLTPDSGGSGGGGASSARRFIQAVDEYVPAPGQFINTMPLATDDDTPETMARKCTEALAADNGALVSLGGFGGYITFHFDHALVNVPGEHDLYIKGNATAGGSEPGIVMVSQDTNGNGLPDDEWFELAGSADVDSVGKVTYGYEICYTRVPMQDVPWRDNQGASGVVARNTSHTQEYFPLWMPDELTLRGTRLPNNSHDASGNGTLWVLETLRYGYVDNLPNANREGNSFNLDWAVDAQRRPVHLTHADFIRVYSAMNQQCGWIGETSTEIAGAEDLHLQASLDAASVVTP